VVSALHRWRLALYPSYAAGPLFPQGPRNGFPDPLQIRKERFRP